MLLTGRVQERSYSTFMPIYLLFTDTLPPKYPPPFRLHQLTHKSVTLPPKYPPPFRLHQLTHKSASNTLIIWVSEKTISNR
jgi:hypothetical protein